MSKESLYLEELEVNARRRRDVLDQKLEANRQWREELEALDESDSRVLANLDAARKPTPPLIERMERLRACPACGEEFKAELWVGDKCPGCGR